MSKKRNQSAYQAKKQATKRAIMRAVASSTAIETGQSIAEIEQTLRAKNSKFQHLSLAD